MKLLVNPTTRPDILALATQVMTDMDDDSAMPFFRPEEVMLVTDTHLVSIADDGAGTLIVANRKIWDVVDQPQGMLWNPGFPLDGGPGVG